MCLDVGQVTNGLLVCCSLCGACLEPEAVVSGFEDVAVMGEAIEEGCGHLGITEDASPFAEAEIGCNGDAGPLVELAEQVEQ